MRRALSILALICMLTAIHAVYAGPNLDELQAFRVLVPSHSKTSGGSSPALSPDKKVLVYQRGNDWWVLHWSGNSSINDTQPEPQKLELPPLPSDKSYGVHFGSSNTVLCVRDADWSPDGKRLVFASQGRLYIAEGFSDEMTDIKVRLLADVRTKDDPLPAVPGKGETPEERTRRAEYSTYPYHGLRWSPDGSRIAAYRQPGGDPNVISIINPDTGEETQIAADGTGFEFIWEQPWSADSKSVTYATIDIYPKGGWTHYGGIATVSVDGKHHSLMLPQKYNFVPYPSWCPTAAKIAFSGPGHDVEVIYPNGTTLKIEQRTYAIYVTDTNGKGTRQLSHEDVQKTYKLSGSEIDRLASEVFNADYKSEITAAELKQFSTATATAADYTNLIELAAIRKAAKTGDPSLRSKVDAVTALKDASIKTKLDKTRKLAEELKQEARNAYSNERYDWQYKLAEPVLRHSQQESWDPVWSPDGNKIAFIRRVAYDRKDLMLIDLKNGRESKLFESTHAMGSVTWTKDSRGIIVETTDMDGFYTTPDTRHSIAGYPEVWYLEPKQQPQ